MTRIELIQTLIDKHGYKSYLEIGVNTPKQPGYSHDSIKIETKHGVDPNVDTTFKMTSDEFFNLEGQSYDIIFIDGDHIYEQAYRDIINSLERLNEGGTIVVHDCNPTTEITQRRIRASDAWHGDVWKAIVRVQLIPDVEVTTLDSDEGCAIIRIKKNDPFTFLDKNRKALLNLISVEQWKSQL
jgi:hypothetical protein